MSLNLNYFFIAHINISIIMILEKLSVLALVTGLLYSCSQPRSTGEEQSDSGISAAEESTVEPDFSMENLLAWCIVPFDAKERNPEERISMLKDLGFSQYAYDWRQKHLDEMEQEIGLARQNNIEMMAVWMWIDANSDSPGNLSSTNERIFSILEKTGLKTEIWLGFNSNYFEGLEEGEAIEKAVEMIGHLGDRASAIECKLALYNHGGWFGEPENQVKIIKEIPSHRIGIIYNFHHAHEQIDRLPVIIEAMRPYLWVVNLNGMKKEGPKILPIGKGTHEKEMIEKFLESGYNGPWGILGHVEERDVKEVLQENLEGLRNLFD